MELKKEIIINKKSKKNKIINNTTIKQCKKNGRISYFYSIEFKLLPNTLGRKNNKPISFKITNDYNSTIKFYYKNCTETFIEYIEFKYEDKFKRKKWFIQTKNLEEIEQSLDKLSNKIIKGLVKDQIEIDKIINKKRRRIK